MTFSKLDGFADWQSPRDHRRAVERRRLARMYRDARRDERGIGGNRDALALAVAVLLILTLLGGVR